MFEKKLSYTNLCEKNKKSPKGFLFEHSNIFCVEKPQKTLDLILRNK